MRFEAIVVALAASGCGFVVTGDQSLADEFARFKAAGGNCVAASGGGGADLSTATSYRALSFGAVLGELVSPSGRVRYPRIGADVEVAVTLQTATTNLDTIDPLNLAGPHERLAFWINAYNARVLAGAAAGFAADPAFRVDEAAFAFFDRREHSIGGRLYSLNEIENGVLRGTRNHASTSALPDDEWDALRGQHEAIFGDEPMDPRVHFVLNCASSSCPPLLPFPVHGDTIEDEMEAATSAFLHDDDVGAGPGGISELFSFYQDDFDAVGGIPSFVERYRPLSEVDIGRFLPYDWSLNLAND